jgi:mannose-6-phosphate isomerase
VSDRLLPVRPVPAPSVRPWAGTRLGSVDAHVGELWLAGPESVVATDRGARTLDRLAAELREAFVGSRGMALLGPRFPLIAKLIDAGDWLSLQVHPDDPLARELYGPDAVGKTEAWLVVEAGPGSELVTGPADGLDDGDLRAAIAAGTASREHCRRQPAVPGEALLLRAGTLHAIGAGAFVYEIEPPSDLTFRISDWGRPTGRTLHVPEALRAIRPALHAEPLGSGFRLAAGAPGVPEFRLELPDLASPVRRQPDGRSLEVVTAIRGALRLEGDGWAERLVPYQTLVIPAATGAYTIAGPADAIACVAGIP